MFLSRRCVINVSRFIVGLTNSERTVSFPILQKLKGSCCECRKQFHSFEWRMTDKIPSSVSSKYESFSEKNSVILDIEEEREKNYQEIITDQFEGLNLQRGVTGVFDIEEIVELLHREKAQNIFVVTVPPELNYVDYMVVVTSNSKRHMLAVFEFIRKVFKRKMSPDDVIPMTEGKGSSDWMAMDLGNIVIHMFSKKAREIYDLESLWSLGRDYDPLSQKKAFSETQVLSNYESVLAELIPASDK